LATALLESPFCSYEIKQPPLKKHAAEDRTSPPKVSFAIAVSVFIPGKKWEDLQSSAQFDCSGADLKSRHIFSLNINTHR